MFEDGRRRDAMIVPGSTSFPAMASLGRRSLPAPRSCALFTCVVPDSDPDHDPDRAFFFFHTLFTLLLFGFPSHFAHCSSSCSFLSASFPLERHSPSRVPYSPIMLGFLLICPFGLLSPLLAFAFYAPFFWLHSPSPPSLCSPFHFQHLSISACAP